MIWLVAAFLSACVFGLAGFLLRYGSYKDYHKASMLLGLYLAGSVVFLGALMINGMIHFNWMVLVFSIVVGLGSYYGNTFVVRAYDAGPACLTTPLMNVSVVLVIAMSALIYHENISTPQYFGIACMVVATTVLGLNFSDISIKSKMWVIFVILGIVFLSLREGGLKIAYEAGLNNTGILFYAYIFATTLSIAALIKSKSLNNDKNIQYKKPFFFGALIGLCSGAGLGLLAFAIARGPASIIIPVFSMRNIISVLLMVFVLKERLLPRQWVAVGLMLLGVAFIS